MNIDQVTGLFAAVTLIEMMVTSGLCIHASVGLLLLIHASPMIAAGFLVLVIAGSIAFNQEPHKP